MDKNLKKHIVPKENELDKQDTYYSLIIERHFQALKHNKDYYIDPETENHVFTSKFLLSKKECCESNCRHCPYNNT